MMMSDLDRLLMVCKHNSSEVARRMGVSPQAVSMWRMRGRLPSSKVAQARTVVAEALQQDAP